jgi:hypothetical protein
MFEELKTSSHVRGSFRRCPVGRARALLVAMALILLASLTAARGEDDVVVEPVSYPHIRFDTDLGLYSVASPNASDRARSGSETFLFGHVMAEIGLAREFSLNIVFHPDPAGDQPPDGAALLLNRQAAFFEQIYADWRPHEELRLFGGKFNAPFGFGYDVFPGVLIAFRAHDVYLIREQLGAGTAWTVIDDPMHGEHRLWATLSTLDTSFLSTTFFTRQGCCPEGWDRYARNYLRQGGSGNSGHLTNGVIALEGGRIAWAPGLTYHLSLLSLGPGKDGTRREWGWSAGAMQAIRLTETLNALLFGEYVEFRNAGGSPLETPRDATDGADTAPAPVLGRRRFSTLGAQISSGPWRATLAWQRDAWKRSVNSLATEQWLEASVGRDLIWGFGLDIGYQYAHDARENGTAGGANGFVSRLGFRQSF